MLYATLSLLISPGYFLAICGNLNILRAKSKFNLLQYDTAAARFSEAFAKRIPCSVYKNLVLILHLITLKSWNQVVLHCLLKKLHTEKWKWYSMGRSLCYFNSVNK